MVQRMSCEQPKQYPANYTIMVQNHKVYLACQPFVIIVIARGTSRNTAIGIDEKKCISKSPLSIM